MAKGQRRTVPHRRPSDDASNDGIPMSKKKDRSWFVCPQWGDLVSRRYASDTEAGRALNADPKVLAKLRSGAPVPKSTLLKVLRNYACRHDLESTVADLVVDTRSR